jgi:hypothetical protein
MYWRFALAACGLAFTAVLPTVAQAQDGGAGLRAAQAVFRLVSEDLASAASYKPLVPSASTGIVGFGVGTAVLFNQIRNRDAFGLALAAPGTPPEQGPASIAQYALRLNKGLPMDLDIGASVSKFVGADIQVAGADLRWAAVLEGTYMPAISLRAAVSALSGSDQVSLRTVSYDVAFSKRFWAVTPYLGIGQVQTQATPSLPGLQVENFNLLRIFGGAGLTVNRMSFMMEVDKTGEAANVGMKLGLQF